MVSCNDPFCEPARLAFRPKNCLLSHMFFVFPTCGYLQIEFLKHFLLTRFHKSQIC